MPDPRHEANFPPSGSLWTERKPYDHRVIEVHGPTEPDSQGRARVRIQTVSENRGRSWQEGTYSRARVDRFRGGSAGYRTFEGERR